jgi:uncharacterized membrane protein YfhO
MFVSIIGAIALFAILTIIFVIIYVLLWYRAFNKLGEKSGVDAFKTAGLLYALGTFIPLLSCIAWIFAAKGYKQLKQQQPPQNNTNNYNTTTTDNEIFCSQCGTKNLTNTTYCKQCGQPLHTTQTNPTN